MKNAVKYTAKYQKTTCKSGGYITLKDEKNAFVRKDKLKKMEYKM